MKETPISPHFIPSISKIVNSSIKICSPYPDAKATFNWLNLDFPYTHTHSHWELLIITKGSLKHILNGKQEIGSRGYACLIRPNDRHRLDYINSEKDAEHINFVFSNETAQKLFQFYNGYSLNLQDGTPLHFFLENAFIDSIIKQALIAQSATKTAYEQFSLLMVHQLITILFSQKLNMNTAYPDWLNDFLDYLHDPTCFEQCANELAAHTPYSYSHLSRLFKQYLGKTLIEYINDLKIVYAKRLLRTSTKSILDISLDLGYDSVSSFNHNFKALTALTPLQYRKKYKSVVAMPEPIDDTQTI